MGYSKINRYISTPPKFAQNLNIVIKNGDGDAKTSKILSKIAKRF